MEIIDYWEQAKVATANSFQVFVIIQAVLNEVLLLLDCWLFTWPLFKDGSLLSLSAVTTIAAYAVAEPLWYSLIYYLPVDAFIIVILMAWVYTGSFHAFITLLKRNHGSNIAGDENFLEEKILTAESIGQAVSKPIYRIDHTILRRKMDLVAPVMLAIATAGSNASWLFWAQSFSSPSTEEWKRGDLLIFNLILYSCVLFYLSCKSITTVRLASKPDWVSISYILNYGIRSGLQMSIILILRAAVRFILGIETTNIAAARVSGSTLVMESQAAQDRRFDSTRYTWFYDMLGRQPITLTYAVYFACYFWGEKMLNSALARAANLPHTWRRLR